MADAIQDLQDLITCEVCLNSYEGRDPRSLPCLHAFCRTCLQQIHQTDLKKDPNHKPELRCPSCRALAPFPGGKIEAFPLYFQANQVKDILDKYERQSNAYSSGIGQTDHTLCSLCKEGQVVACCFPCNQSMCHGCTDKHGNNRRFKGHTQVKVDSKTIHSLVCQEHDTLVEVLCTSCWIPVCKRCQVTSHADHIVEEFCTHSGGQQNEIHTSRRIQSNFESLENNMQEICCIETEFKSHTKAVNRGITEQKNKLLKQIDKQEQQLRSHLNEYQAVGELVMECKKKEISERRENLMRLSQNWHTINHPIPVAHAFSFTRADHYKAKLQTQITQPRVYVDRPRYYQYTTSSDTVCLGDLTLLSELDVNAPPVISPSSPPTPLSRLSSSSSSSSASRLSSPSQSPRTSLEQNSDSTTPDRLSLPKPVPKLRNSLTRSESPIPRMSDSRLPDGDVHSSVIWQVDTEDGIRGLVILQTGDVIGIEVNIHKKYLSMYTKYGIKRPMPFSFEHSNPCAVSIHEPTSTLGIVQANKVMIITHGSRGWTTSNTITLDFQPSVMMMPSSQEIILVGSDNHSLYKYRKDGKRLWTKKLNYPCYYMCTDSQGRLIMSSFNKVHIHSPRGDPQLSIPQKSDIQYLQDPRGLCTDSHDNIIVADKNKTILMFGPQGKFIKVLVRIEDEPSDIALCEDRYLAVGSYKKMLYMLDLNQ